VKETLSADPKKEVQPKRATLDFQEQIFDLIPLAGTMEVTDEQKKILFDPVKDEDVEIRPDGLVYLPWMEYVARLRDAFSLGWAIIPQGGAKIQDSKVMWAFWLIINGKPAGFAVGEQEYQPTNARMTYGDALEGAKSNALMRLCKGIGISLELWRPSFVRAWKEKFAEQYKDEKKGMLWRKKGGNGNKTAEGKQDSSDNLISDPQRKRFYAIAKKTGASDDLIKEWLYREYNFEHSKDITKETYEEICTRVVSDLSVKEG
jgi:hypothetical protein